MKKRILTALLAAVVLCVPLALSGCDTGAAVTETEGASCSRDTFAMDTYMTVTAYGENCEPAVTEALARIQALDQLLSIGKEDSEVSQMNRTGSAQLSADTAYLMERALEISKSTDGAFAPALFPIVKAWGFPSGQYRVPSDHELAALLPKTTLDCITYDAAAKQITLSDGTEIDFGGIAKGYTSAQIMEIFRQHGVTSGMVSLGGNVQLLGTKPDGSNWRIGVQDPKGGDQYLGIVSAADKAIITSGGYERFFEQDGVVYHHILDPKTGKTARSGLQSVTIVSDDGTLADALSTALFVMGQEKATTFWRAHQDTFDAILYTDNGEIFVTDGLRDSFTSDHPWTVIESQP